jgi:hypothetical protein
LEFSKKLRGTNSGKAQNNAIPIGEWETYFKNLHESKAPEDSEQKFVNDIEKVFKLHCLSDSPCKFMDNPFSQSEIVEGIQKLKLKKSAGPDGITNEMLKAGQHMLSNRIKLLFNQILTDEIFPTE